ncbi:MAG: heavy metal translocating P-type ATPase [Cyanobium sp.]|jgi:heavy metal translocating P-type ATPase
MIPLFIVALGGVTLAASFVARRPRLSLVDQLGAVDAPGGDGVAPGSGLASSIATVQTSLVNIDNHYQNLVVTHLDPWIAGQLRNQQMLELTQGQSRELSINEKNINRSLLTGGFGLTLIGVSRLTGWMLAPYVIIIGVCNSWPLIQECWRIAIDERRFSLLHLMLLYLLYLWLGGNYLIGTIGILFGGICQKFELLTKMVTRYSLTSLMSGQPERVWVIKDGQEISIPFQDLQIGDLLVLKAGQPVPVDGIVVHGMATLDQHKLTGESQPVEKIIDDPIFATTLVLGGTIQVRVEKTGAETAAAHISDVLSRTVEAQEVRMADQCKDLEKYRWPMLAAGAFAWLLRGPQIGLAMLGTNYMLSLIPLRLLTLLNGLGSGAVRGILIKDGRALERLSAIDTIVFDKTGTLTLDEQIVTQIHCCAQRSEAEVLAWAAAAEHRQTHPIAKAILIAADQRALEIPHLDDAHYTLGLGITAEIQGHLVHIGSERFLGTYNLTLPSVLQDVQRAADADGHALVFVAEDDAVIGALELAAVVRPEARATIDWLRHLGLSLYIISGDHEAPTAKLAAELGMDGYFANTLPNQKAERLQELQSQGKHVCFIGDGINDAVALRQAEVSISLRGATTVATDAAQIILMEDDLTQLRPTWALALGFEDCLADQTRQSMMFSLVAASGVLILPFGLLLTELLWGVQVISGVILSQRPLLKTEHETFADR